MEKFIPVVFAIGFPVMWVSISLLLSHMGGWSKLAKHYADTEQVHGETYYMRSGSIGVVNYKSCLILSVSETGLRLSVLLPFRIGHPPIFIPWDQFHSVSEKRVFFFPFLDTYVGTPVVANIVLPIWVRDYLPSDKRPS
jgi:hypothetical protein